MKKIMATFIVGISVVIGQVRFDQVNSVKIKSTWEELGDSCTITLPFANGRAVPDSRNNESVVFVTKNGQELALRQGDYVTVDMIYKKGEKTWQSREFEGFVRRVKPNRPVEIECEDFIFLFRKVMLTNSYASTNINSVLRDILEKVNAKYPDYQISIIGDASISVDRLRFDAVNAATALQQLKERTLMVAWFRGRTLYFGPAFVLADQKPVSYYITGQLTNLADADLTVVSAEDRPIRVKVTGTDAANKSITVFYPEKDNGGEETNINLKSVSSVESLQKIAKQAYENKSYTGLEGDVTGWLIPVVRHSMAVKLVDETYALRNGTFFVDEVETTFGRGIKRVVKLGRKLS